VWHNATVIDWHDGDTCRVLVDRGDDDRSEWMVRVLGAATRELGEPGGIEARAALLRMLPPGSPVVLAALDDDKYGGRHLARVFHQHEGAAVDLAARLIAEGWACPWDGRGAQPKPSWPRRTRRREALAA
jgi:endonuclease YncB( thermonuclease family)